MGKSINNNLTTGGGTYESVKGFLSGIVSPFYLVKLIHQNRCYVISRHWNSEQVRENIDFMIAKNNQGFNVYIRPADDRFILLDDLNRAALPELAKLKPCLLMESSPDNFQAWLKLQQIPQERDQQAIIWQTLARMFHADMKSAKPDQIGRLPGFLNMKPKYSPDFPLVKLHRFHDRFSTWSLENLPATSQLPTLASPPVVKLKSSHDRSGFDWAVACSLVARGWNDDHIKDYLLKRSQKASTRRDDYIGRTIAAARRKIKHQ